MGHPSVQDFPDRSVCALIRVNLQVEVVWDLICKICGTWCACPASLGHLHSVNPVLTSCTLLAACAKENLGHAPHM